MNLNQLARNLKYLETATYADLSTEYYDPRSHPTCADFRDASRKLLSGLLHDGLIKTDCAVCEVGAGKSLIAEVSIELGLALDSFLLTDVSFDMLAHSRQFSPYHAQLLVANAFNLPFPDEAIDIMVAVLPDPYNVPIFWEEAFRVLNAHGKMVFIVPSYIWATKFRNSDRKERDGVARFETRTGRELFVPSYIFDESEQINLACNSGFECLDCRAVAKVDLSLIRSAKLCLLDPKDAIVDGYLFRKR